MHPKATRVIAEGKISDDDDTAANENESSCSFRSVNTNADLGLIVKPLVLRDFLKITNVRVVLQLNSVK